MSTTWLVVAGVGAATVALKGAGTLALGSQALPPRAKAVIALFPRASSPHSSSFRPWAMTAPSS
jgi:hypothetical protein